MKIYIISSLEKYEDGMLDDVLESKYNITIE